MTRPLTSRTPEAEAALRDKAQDARDTARKLVEDGWRNSANVIFALLSALDAYLSDPPAPSEGRTPGKMKELSDKATPGPWMAVPARLIIGDHEGPIMSYLRGDIGSPDGMKVSLGSERVADHYFVAALVNAYRAGELVERGAQSATAPADAEDAARYRYIAGFVTAYDSENYWQTKLHVEFPADPPSVSARTVRQQFEDAVDQAMPKARKPQ